MTDSLYIHARTLTPESPFVQETIGDGFGAPPKLSWKELDARLQAEQARYLHRAAAADHQGLHCVVWKNSHDDNADAVVLKMSLDRREGHLYFAAERGLPVVVSLGGSFTALCHDGRMYYAPQRLVRFGFHHLEPMAIRRAAMGAFALQTASELCS